MSSTKQTQTIAAYDNAPFFEKAFKYAVKHNVIDAARVDEIVNDAATGAVQIAEYFGESAHLRKNLEISMKRMVSLVSLYLEDTTGNELDKAAMLLKEKPFRALSRGGSQMLKVLFSLPEDGYFGSTRLDSERDFLKKSLVKGMPVTKYRQTVKDCEQFKKELDFASWIIKKTGTPISKLNEFHASAEHVIRTYFLTLAYGTKKVGGNKSGLPDEAGLFEIFTSMRKEWGFLGDITCSTKFMDDIPAEFLDYANNILATIKTEDLPKIVNPSVPLQSVFSDLKDRKYFYLHDHFNEMSKFDKMLAVDWFALTGGTEDDALLLTLFLCAASGLEQKTSLKVSEAKKAVLSIREHGILQSDVLKLIEKAPHDEIEQLRSLWSDFIEEAQPFLLDHSDEQLKEVMVYLEDHCNIQKAKK
ncbi:hypothetical protein GALL_269400 [mine drainage metagenome]|uniref:Uncharacterized protein n=1 Tax=mine drainage metagenome TaxID=410659 RepID=A0A1J5RGM7_9ZZZZ